MKHLRIKTDNLVWAICLSGAAISASKNVANPAFNLVIESDVPEIKFLASAFSTKTPGVQYTDIVIPTDEKELAQLDIAGTRKLERELRVLHGIDVTEEVNVLTLLDLSTIVLDQYGIKSQAKTFYPKLSKPQYEKYQEYDCVITKSEYLKWAQEYARGYGREFNILDATNLPVSEVIKAINNPGLKLLVAHASDPILFVAKSYYKDYDNIAQTFCTLIMYLSLDLIDFAVLYGEHVYLKILKIR